MTDAHVAELLDELTPSYDGRRGDWERIAADAEQTQPRALRRSTRLRLGVVVGAIAAVAALVLSSPFGSERGNVLDRALAAVGDGPVLHVVLRGSTPRPAGRTRSSVLAASFRTTSSSARRTSPRPNWPRWDASTSRRSSPGRRGSWARARSTASLWSG
ncbi:MAG: hypothetical protein E6G50_02570 [Actinobacteria bacterium]|nr:MAG: hypothetical protein E6G50_02570 [Actinomycetota bacterium]